MITKEELATLKQLCRNNREAQEILERVDTMETPCEYCDHFRGETYCEKWQAEVPVEHRQEGCAAWETDEIPF